MGIGIADGRLAVVGGNLAVGDGGVAERLAVEVLPRDGPDRRRRFFSGHGFGLLCRCRELCGVGRVVVRGSRHRRPAGERVSEVGVLGLRGRRAGVFRRFAERDGRCRNRVAVAADPGDGVVALVLGMVFILDEHGVELRLVGRRARHDGYERRPAAVERETVPVFARLGRSDVAVVGRHGVVVPVAALQVEAVAVQEGDFIGDWRPEGNVVAVLAGERGGQGDGVLAVKRPAGERVAGADWICDRRNRDAVETGDASRRRAAVAVERQRVRALGGGEHCRVRAVGNGRNDLGTPAAERIRILGRRSLGRRTLPVDGELTLGDDAGVEHRDAVFVVPGHRPDALDVHRGAELRRVDDIAGHGGDGRTPAREVVDEFAERLALRLGSGIDGRLAVFNRVGDDEGPVEIVPGDGVGAASESIRRLERQALGDRIGGGGERGRPAGERVVELVGIGLLRVGGNRDFGPEDVLGVSRGRNHGVVGVEERDGDLAGLGVGLELGGVGGVARDGGDGGLPAGELHAFRRGGRLGAVGRNLAVFHAVGAEGLAAASPGDVVFALRGGVDGLVDLAGDGRAGD